MESIKIILSFLYLSILSSIIGAVVGLISAKLFKEWRALTHSTIVECSLVLCFGYLSYIMAEILEVSSIVSMLSCGIFMG